MVKVRCIVCGVTAYTAAPRCIVCSCGGRFRIIPEKRANRIVKLNEAILQLFDFSNLINDEGYGSLN